MAAEPAYTELDHVTELYAISEKENRQLKTKLHRLENQMAGVHEDSPEAREVKELLDLWWVRVKGSHPNVAHGLDSTRAAKVRSCLKRRKKMAREQGLEDSYGLLMCKKAIIGVTQDAWAMGRNPKTGGKSFCDIAEHVLNTDDDVEKWAALFDEYISHLTEEPMSEETVKSLRSQRDKRDRVEQRAREHWAKVEREDPGEAVLSALSRAGCEWRCKPSGDGWVAQCPAHQGTKLNLAIDWGDDIDGLVLKCWSRGCETAEVMAALDLPLFVLFRDSQRKAA
jgi:hypothetical protein